MPRCVLVALAFTTTSALAQIPDGSFLVSSFSASNSPTPGGIFLVDPRVPGTPTRITGLDPSLVGMAGVSSATGANAIAINDDQIVFVGNVGEDGTAIELHELVISAGQAFTIRTTPVGVVNTLVSPSGGISQIQALPNGDCVFCVANIAAGPPMNGNLVGYFDSVTGTITPISFPTSSVFAQSIAVDADATTVYVTTFPGYSIHSVPIAGGSATLVGTGNLVAGLDVNGDGDLITSSFDSVIEMDVATGATTVLGTPGNYINGLAVERATEYVVCAMSRAGGVNDVVYVDDVGGVNMLGPIEGICSGVTILHNPRTYGLGTPGNASYEWRVHPNPGGLPTIGNTAFGVQLDASSGDASGVLLFGASRTFQSVLGFQLLVQPFVAVPMPASGFLSIPVNVNGTVGTTVALQTLHLDAGAPQGIAASNGFWAVIMP